MSKLKGRRIIIIKNFFRLKKKKGRGKLLAQTEEG